MIEGDDELSDDKRCRPRFPLIIQELLLQTLKDAESGKTRADASLHHSREKFPPLSPGRRAKT